MDQPGKNSEEPPVYPEPNNNTDAAGSSLPGTSKADGKEIPVEQARSYSFPMKSFSVPGIVVPVNRPDRSVNEFLSTLELLGKRFNHKDPAAARAFSLSDKALSYISPALSPSELATLTAEVQRLRMEQTGENSEQRPVYPKPSTTDAGVDEITKQAAALSLPGTNKPSETEIPVKQARTYSFPMKPFSIPELMVHRNRPDATERELLSILDRQTVRFRGMSREAAQAAALDYMADEFSATELATLTAALQRQKMEQTGENSEERPATEPKDATEQSLPGTSQPDGTESSGHQTGTGEERFVAYVLMTEVASTHEVSRFSSVCYSGISTLIADGSPQSVYDHQTKVREALANPASTEIEPIHKYLAVAHKNGIGFHFMAMGGVQTKAGARRLSECFNAATLCNPFTLLYPNYENFDREEEEASNASEDGMPELSSNEKASIGTCYLMETFKQLRGTTYATVNI